MIREKSYLKFCKVGIFFVLIIGLTCQAYGQNTNVLLGYDGDGNYHTSENTVWVESLQEETPTETSFIPTSTPTVTSTVTPSTPTMTFTPVDTFTPTYTATQTPTPTEATAEPYVIYVPKGEHVYREDVIIPEGMVMVIEPGAILSFENNTDTVDYPDGGEIDFERPEFIVYGKLVANASGSETIYFRAVTPLPTAVFTPTPTPTGVYTPIIPPTVVLPTSTPTQPRNTSTPTATPTEENVHIYKPDPSITPPVIPEDATGTITSEIIISENAKIVDVNVPINISHADVAELIVTLSHEQTLVTLHNLSHSGEKSINWIYDDDGIPPDGTPGLSIFNGEDKYGTWFIDD